MRTRSLNWLIILLIGFYFSCSATRSETLTSKKVVSDGREMLIGAISPAQLYFDFPEWQENEKLYQPDSLILEALHKFKNYHVDVYFGTWCGDSRDGVPQFIKTMDKAGAAAKYTLYAVNRAKQIPEADISAKNILRVPTYIITIGGIEAGRIIEFPEISIEADLLTILKSANVK